MRGRTYSVVAVIRGVEQRLVLVTDDALGAFDFMSQKTLLRKNDASEVTEYRVYDSGGTLISQALTRML